MVMLHLLHSACLRADVPLVVAHIDHQLRSDSALDHALVKDIARKLGRPFESAKINVRTGNSVQSQARQQRYAALVRIANARDIDTIVTAHHQDDLKENHALQTVLGRFGSIEERRFMTEWHIFLWRPLLHLSKTEIYEMAKERGIQWREDPSNSSDKYTRNMVRIKGVSATESVPVATTSPRRVAAFRWTCGPDLESLISACREIEGVALSSRQIDLLVEGARRVHIRGGLVIRHDDFFEICRTIGQGERALPVEALSLDREVNFVKLEF